MRQQSPDSPRKPGADLDAGGFSLIELLVVVAVIAVLVGLLMPALRSARASSAMVRELSTARELMRAWSAYAYDNGGVLLPGYYTLGGLPAVDQAGNDLSGYGVQAHGYVWRLASYLDYDFRGLYLDKELLTQLQSNPSHPDYLMAVYPSLGINGAFVGGDTESFYAYNDAVLAHFGKFYLTRLSEVRHPAGLIVFASARVNGTVAADAYPGAHMVEGYFRLEPPYFTQRKWAQRYDPECQDPCKTSDFGNVSLRHQGRQAVVGFFDGSAATLDEGTIQDMRHWADQADRPDWKLQPLH